MKTIDFEKYRRARGLAGPTPALSTLAETMAEDDLRKGMNRFIVRSAEECPADYVGEVVKAYLAGVRARLEHLEAIARDSGM